MIIKKTNNTPKVIFDKENRELSFDGATYPDDADSFFIPIISYLHNYLKELKGNEVIVKCKFTLLNSSSAQYMFSLFDKLNTNGNVSINWYYEEDDECMFEEGVMYKDGFSNLNFNLIGVDDFDF